MFTLFFKISCASSSATIITPTQQSSASSRSLAACAALVVLKESLKSAPCSIVPQVTNQYLSIFNCFKIWLPRSYAWIQRQFSLLVTLDAFPRMFFKLVNFHVRPCTPRHNSSPVLVVPRLGSETTCEGRRGLYPATQNCGCHV